VVGSNRNRPSISNRRIRYSQLAIEPKTRIYFDVLVTGHGEGYLDLRIQGEEHRLLHAEITSFGDIDAHAETGDSGSLIMYETFCKEHNLPRPKRRKSKINVR